MAWQVTGRSLPIALGVLYRAESAESFRKAAFDTYTTLSRFTLPWNKSCMEEPNRLWPNHLNIDVGFFWFQTNWNLFCVLRLPKKHAATKTDRKEVQQIIIFWLVRKKFFRSVQVYILLLQINYNAKLVSDIILPKSIYLTNESLLS